jgi:hypothetical protein
MLASGCELLEQFEDGGGLVNFYSAHHASARDGEFPEKPASHIEFDNDTGWHVILTHALVTTTEVQLHKCSGESVTADFYWGEVCESMTEPDLWGSGIGAVEADAGNYCSATVVYGPYSGGGDIEGHNAEGDTVYLRGAAEKGDQHINFELRSTGTIAVTVDISSVADGGPLVLDHDQYFAKELTIAKTYDRFFDGVDFNEIDSMNFENILLDTLEFETHIVTGTEVAPFAG